MYFQEHISTDTFGKEKFNLIALKIFKLRIFCKFYRWITFINFLCKYEQDLSYRPGKCSTFSASFRF